ncbi:uncharacterized protein Cbei_0202-like, partial [Phoenix dactylifera]|uniref:Uncharacterized protein Cbei_0202-like n=1 Tax=Phoenix dactylifera TaxID=42345 RepID=A0A8B9A7Y9_PHODC
VMKTLVQFGAPPNILVDGKPHLGTNRLVPLLRNFRQHLKELGVDIKFGTRLNDLIVQNKQVLGVKVCDARHGPGYDDKKLSCDAVVLAVGHSARDVYPMLLEHNVGLRIEHPQELINSIQYSALAAEVHEGRGRIPVADYKVVKYISGENDGVSFWFRGTQNPSELCVNGMSFSRRASRWANAALVVTVSSNDFDSFRSYGALAGVEFQHEEFMFIEQSHVDNLLETRTSSPVQILRHADTYESTSLKGLYPIGEGAGYAGGIVSAAVDGMYCGFAVAKSLGLYQGDIESILGKAQKNTGFVKY